MTWAAADWRIAAVVFWLLLLWIGLRWWLGRQSRFRRRMEPGSLERTLLRIAGLEPRRRRNLLDRIGPYNPNQGGLQDTPFDAPAGPRRRGRRR